MTIYNIEGQAFVELYEGDFLWISPIEEIQEDKPDEVMILVCKALERKQLLENRDKKEVDFPIASPPRQMC